VQRFRASAAYTKAMGEGSRQYLHRNGSIAPGLAAGWAEWPEGGATGGYLYRWQRKGGAYLLIKLDVNGVVGLADGVNKSVMSVGWVAGGCW
jgi:hypothetical protein